MRNPVEHVPHLVLSDDIYRNTNFLELFAWYDNVSKRSAVTPSAQQIQEKVIEKYGHIIDKIITIVYPLFLDTGRIQELRRALQYVAHLAINSRYQKTSFDDISQEVYEAIYPFLYPDKELMMFGDKSSEESWENRKTFNSLVIYFLGLVFKGLDFEFSYDSSKLDACEYEKYFKKFDYSHLFCQKVGNKVSVIINNLSVLLVPNDPEFDEDIQGVGLQVSWCLQKPTSPSAS